MNKVILAVGAHPDDTDFGASGTIAKWIGEGATAYYLLCTNGSKGSSDPHMTHQKLITLRQQEQKDANKVLGVKQCFFLTHPDTELVADQVLKEEIVRLIRTLKPDIVMTMDPTYYYSTNSLLSGSGMVNHTDHRAAALATLDAVFPLARDRLTFLEHEKEGLKPHKVKELWLTSFEKIDTVVDITHTMEKKIETLRRHKSQFEDFKKIEERVRNRAMDIGKQKGYTYAENFIRILLP